MLLALTDVSATIAGQIELEDFNDGARRRIPKSEALQARPRLHITRLACQSGCAPGADEVILVNGAGVDNPAVVASNHQQVDLSMAEQGNQFGDVDLSVCQKFHCFGVHGLNDCI